MPTRMNQCTSSRESLRSPSVTKGFLLLQEATRTDRETVAALHGLGDMLEQRGALVNRTARPDFRPSEVYNLYHWRILSAKHGGSHCTKQKRFADRCTDCRALSWRSHNYCCCGANRTSERRLRATTRLGLIRTRLAASLQTIIPAAGTKTASL